MTRLTQLLIAGGLGMAVTLAANALAVLWLRETLFGSDGFHDGFAAIVTLAFPALLGGIGLGLVARSSALNASVIVFAVFCVAGLVHPFWQVPPVSRHTPLLHYFLYSPLVALAFGALGGWLGGQFATGRFTLADKQPVTLNLFDD